MSIIKKIAYGITGYVYIPEHIIECKEKKLLHISDTPSCFFSPLKRLLKVLKPYYIIHTGDMVDDIKLELWSQSIGRYEYNLQYLIDILEKSSAKDIYIALGNHDKSELIKKFSKRCNIIPSTGHIQIENLNICISHYAKDTLKNPGQYNLYGHDLSLLSTVIDGKIFLNGIKGINIITLPGQDIYSLPYPLGTDDMRLGRCKIGL